MSNNFIWFNGDTSLADQKSSRNQKEEAAKRKKLVEDISNGEGP
jgi:hypothetical protein